MNIVTETLFAAACLVVAITGTVYLIEHPPKNFSIAYVQQ